MSIGRKPLTETLELTPRGDFRHQLTAPTGSPFPDGFTARIEILKTGLVGETPIATWSPTTVSTTELVWNVQSNTATTGVDAVITAGAKRFRLYGIFPGSPTDDDPWYTGQIKVNK